MVRFSVVLFWLIFFIFLIETLYVMPYLFVTILSQKMVTVLSQLLGIDHLDKFLMRNLSAIVIRRANYSIIFMLIRVVQIIVMDISIFQILN